MLLIDRLFTKESQELAPAKSFISQNAQTRVNSQAAKKLQSQGEKAMALFGTILDNLGSNQKFEKLVDETLMTMVNFASQNVKFKNAFIVQNQT